MSHYVEPAVTYALTCCGCWQQWIYASELEDQKTYPIEHGWAHVYNDWRCKACAEKERSRG